MTDTQIVQQLEKQGYSNVKVTDHDRGHVDVMAMKGGQQRRQLDTIGIRRYCSSGAAMEGASLDSTLASDPHRGWAKRSW